MDYIKALVTIEGMAPYSQSHNHATDKLEGELPDAYDQRTWRNKMNVEIINGERTVVIPAFGLQSALAAAAKYSKRKIEGQRNATWTAKFKSGVAVMGPAILNIDPDTVQCVVISANADGVRGSGKRVTRRFPQIPMGWVGKFEVMILDPIITEDIFREMMELAGLFIGVGQFRPENGGTNGRFIVKDVQWQDNRRKVKKAA